MQLHLILIHYLKTVTLSLWSRNPLWSSGHRRTSTSTRNPWPQRLTGRTGRPRGPCV
ncbi:hypothetical protein [European catfish virus]|uniref:Uncharacterized protein n=1 Tax=European catfish virus TaxID=84739 RepID=I2BFL7_9VIRU|nr:hypothetical protein A190_gp037 [European catfish virus]AFJ52320.1 hypothetical protein [European catfish virus]AMZ04866.1 hypothetical protein [European catfish virus]AMZ05002.1 hypothetical protein [European catfish virus]